MISISITFIDRCSEFRIPPNRNTSAVKPFALDILKVTFPINDAGASDSNDDGGSVRLSEIGVVGLTLFGVGVGAGIGVLVAATVGVGVIATIGIVVAAIVGVGVVATVGIGVAATIVGIGVGAAVGAGVLGSVGTGVVATI